jgi:predicted nucleic acid-binding protein
VREQAGLLLDTDVVTEVRSAEPHAAVVDFLQQRRHLRIFISALTVGELRAAHAQQETASNNDDGRWLAELTKRFEGFILPVDLKVATVWGPMSSRPDVPAVESLIAATAVRYCLTVVSRNVAGYSKLAVPAIDPWQVGRYAVPQTPAPDHKPG